MTDLSGTKLCAEAMKYNILTEREGNAQEDYGPLLLVAELNRPYWPLDNSAQAFALDSFILRHGSFTTYPHGFFFTGKRNGVAGFIELADMTDEANRRRARVLCVAHIMREGKK